MKKQIKKRKQSKQHLSSLRIVGIVVAILMFIGFSALTVWVGIYSKQMMDYCDSLNWQDPMWVKGSSYLIMLVLLVPALACVALLNLWSIRNYLHENDIDEWHVARGILFQGLIPGIIMLMLKESNDKTGDGKDYSLDHWGSSSSDDNGIHFTNRGIIIEYW